MRFIRAQSREQHDNHLVPLINVIFLMLIFFMIIGSIRPAEPLPVAPPLSAQGRDADPEQRILLLGADGRLALDGEIVTRQILNARLQDWLAPPAEPDTPTLAELTLKADAAVRAGILRETLELLRAAGIETVWLVTAEGMH